MCESGVMGDRSRLCSVWLGSETGILKGVSLSRKQAFNFCNTSHLSRDQEVRALCWGDAAESELLVGCVDATVKTFSLEKGAFTESRRCGDPAEGCFSGLAALGGDALVTCAESGALRVWRQEGGDEPVTQVDAGKNVCRMRQSPANPNKVATGGKENGLKIWDLQRPEQPAFSAKNLRDDWLDLRRPYWVRDMAFIPDSDKVVTCTGYHQVCSCDSPSAGQNVFLKKTHLKFTLARVKGQAYHKHLVCVICKRSSGSELAQKSDHTPFKKCLILSFLKSMTKLKLV